MARLPDGFFGTRLWCRGQAKHFRRLSRAARAGGRVGNLGNIPKAAKPKKQLENKPRGWRRPSVRTRPLGVALPQFTHPVSLRHAASEVMHVISVPCCRGPPTPSLRADPLTAAWCPWAPLVLHLGTVPNTTPRPAAPPGHLQLLAPGWLWAHGLGAEATGASNIPMVQWWGKTPHGSEGEEGAALPGGVFLHSLKATETCRAGFGAGNSAGAAELW